MVYTFNEIVLDESLGANSSSFFSEVKEVVAKDDYTVVFKMENPVAALPAYLSFNTEILPEHLFNGQDPWEFSDFNKKRAGRNGSV